MNLQPKKFFFIVFCFAPVVCACFSTSFPGSSPTRPQWREKERPSLSLSPLGPSRRGPWERGCVFLFIHSFRLSLPWNSPRNSRKNDCVHCLSSCTIWSLGFLSGLSLYWNNIFIEISFCVVLSKPQRVKITQQKQTTAPLEPSLLRDHFNGFFKTVATIFTHYTTHSGVIYSRLTFLRSSSCHIFSKPTNCPLEIAAFNHGFLIQSNSSLWKY